MSGFLFCLTLSIRVVPDPDKYVVLSYIVAIQGHPYPTDTFESHDNVVYYKSNMVDFVQKAINI